MNATKRIQSELRSLRESPSKDQIWVELGEGDTMKKLKGFIKGPPDTSYEDGVFELSIDFPEDYPFVPPKVRFTTSVWHCNISSANGYICLDVLDKNWAPAMVLETVLLSIQQLLASPVDTDPADAVVAKTMRDPNNFAKTARYWVYNYAMKDKPPKLPEDLVPFEDKVVDMVRHTKRPRNEVIKELSSSGWDYTIKKREVSRRSVRSSETKTSKKARRS